MKICIPATGPGLDSMIDPRFGRSQFLLFADSKTGKIIESIPNNSLMAMRGAGIAVSQLAVDRGAKVVIAGDIGPNAFGVLNMAKVKIYSGIFGLTIKQVIEKFQKGGLKETPQPTVMGHFGAGPGGRGRGMGPGSGRGRGRGGF